MNDREQYKLISTVCIGDDVRIDSVVLDTLLADDSPAEHRTFPEMAKA